MGYQVLSGDWWFGDGLSVGGWESDSLLALDFNVLCGGRYPETVLVDAAPPLDESGKCVTGEDLRMLSKAESPAVRFGV